MHKGPVNALSAFAIILTVLFAGCGSKPGGGESVPPPTTEPVVTDDTGAVAGIIVSEELIAIPGAQLLLTESGQSTVSGADGRYAINGVIPGNYQLSVAAIGHESVSVRIEVVAAQITSKDFTLPTIVVGVPHHESIPFVGRFDCSTALFDVLWQACVPVVAANDVLFPGSNATFYFTKPEGVTHLVAELRWTAASAGTGRNLDFNLVGPWGHPDTQWYANVYGPSPLKIQVTVGEQFSNPASPGGGVGSSDDDQVVDPEDTELGIDIYASPLYTDEITGQSEREALVGVTFQQNFEGFVTLFYDEVPDEGFSAFPDA